MLDSLDQLQHLGRSRAAFVDDKISVHFRDPRMADARILQPKFVDQFSGRDSSPDS